MKHFKAKWSLSTNKIQINIIALSHSHFIKIIPNTKLNKTLPLTSHLNCCLHLMKTCLHGMIYNSVWKMIFLFQLISMQMKRIFMKSITTPCETWYRTSQFTVAGSVINSWGLLLRDTSSITNYYCKFLLTTVAWGANAWIQLQHVHFRRQETV